MDDCNPPIVDKIQTDPWTRWERDYLLRHEWNLLIWLCNVTWYDILCDDWIEFLQLYVCLRMVQFVQNNCKECYNPWVRPHENDEEVSIIVRDCQ